MSGRKDSIMTKRNSVTVNGIEYGINSKRKLVIYSVDSIVLPEEFVCLDKDVSKIKIETNLERSAEGMIEFLSKLYIGNSPMDTDWKKVGEWPTAYDHAKESYIRAYLDFGEDSIIIIKKIRNTISISKVEKRW